MTRRLLWVTAVYLAVHAFWACASTLSRQPSRAQKVWILSAEAHDGDLFCAAPKEQGDAWPRRCRSVREVRDLLGSLSAD